MSKRVGIGSLGTVSSVEQFGIRVAKSGYDAIPTAYTDPPVDTANLAFDSLNPVYDLPLYRIYDVTVAAATHSGTYSPEAVEGTYTVSYGETLSSPPIPFVCDWDGTTLSTDFFYDNLFASHNLQLFGVTNDTPRGGWAEANTTHLKVYNLNNFQNTFRVFLLKGVS